MVEDVVYPVLFSEGGDIFAFRTYEDAAGYVEAQDVRAGYYSGYDKNGRKLVLSSDDYDTLKIALAETEPDHLDELRNKLVENAISSQSSGHLKTTPEAIQNASMDELFEFMFEAEKAFEAKGCLWVLVMGFGTCDTMSWLLHHMF